MTERLLTTDNVPLNVAGDAGAGRAIVVLQEAFGVNDHIRDVTERFAIRGFYAVALELFHRSGSPEVAYDNFADAVGAMGALTRETLEFDLHATVTYLHELGFARQAIGIVGYCMGGTVALFANTLDLVGAAVSFYGGGVTNGRFGLDPLVDLAPHLRAPWLGLYGDLDKGIPVEQVEQLRDAARQSGQTTDVVRYPDGDHGFHCDQRPGNYHEASAADAAERCYVFFEKNLRAN